VLSFLPSFQFDMPTALRMLTPITGDRLTSTAAVLFCMKESGVLKYNQSSGVFSLQASIHRVARALIVVSELDEHLSDVFNRVCSFSPSPTL
jgi:hypothetical protein